MECSAHPRSALPLSFIYSANGHGVGGSGSWEKSGFIRVLIPIKGQDSHLRLPLCVCARQRYLGHAPVIPDRSGDMAWIWIRPGHGSRRPSKGTEGKKNPSSSSGTPSFPKTSGLPREREHRKGFGGEEGKIPAGKTPQKRVGIKPFSKPSWNVPPWS